MRADFLANASHELRTPLASLTLLIETIAGPARDNAADRERFLDMMQVQAERMRRLIDAPDHARELGANARELAVRRFGLDRFKRDWDAAFAEAIALAGGTPMPASPSP